MASSSTRHRQRVLADGDLEVLGHLELVDHLADLEPDLVGTDEASLLERQRRWGRGLPRWRPTARCACASFFGQQGIATGDEPFVGVVGMGELGQVALVEEAEL